MKTAIKYLRSTTINFLIEKIGKMTDYQDANELLTHLTGIDAFFRNQEDFLTLLEHLKPNFMVCEGVDRREYGDFQTPYKLTDSICSYLDHESVSPDVIIEPTFGKGSFLISALKCFPNLKKIYGVEIYESHYWEAKFAILELFIKHPDLNKPRILLYLNDIFKFEFMDIEKEREIENYNVLVLGNPPWVTNSELGILNSKNLPKKINIKSLNGLDAITGKGNFDISEYIILMMLNTFSRYKGHMAMLAKNSVIKNLVHHLPAASCKINDMIALKINAKEYFNASVEASLFRCSYGSNKRSLTCKVSSFISQNSIENEFGWVGDKFVSDVDLYEKNKKYDGVSPYIWRQGVKHDCSKIMELQLIDGKYFNGFKRELNIEKGLIYDLVKSSDLSSPVITKPRKYVIITQNRIGEDTIYLADKFPKLYQYLTENKNLFKQRKSCIYKNKPPFSIFGIGDYSFKPYKVAISGLYKRSTFSLIVPENEKPMMLDDTCYSLGFDSLPKAIFVWTILNSGYVQQLLAALTFLDAKRPYTKDILMRISIDKVAKDMSYNEIINQIKSLDKKMLVNITEDKWKMFVEEMNKRNSGTKQLSLFEITANRSSSLSPAPFG
jgi:N-6 DNA Methylase